MENFFYHPFSNQSKGKIIAINKTFPGKDFAFEIFSDIQNYFVTAMTASKESRLRLLHFKILHNILLRFGFLLLVRSRFHPNVINFKQCTHRQVELQ